MSVNVALLAKLFRAAHEGIERQLPWHSSTFDEHGWGQPYVRSDYATQEAIAGMYDGLATMFEKLAEAETNTPAFTAADLKAIDGEVSANLFTREDVELLRKMWHHDDCGALFALYDHHCDCETHPDCIALESLAARIESLLPPRPPVEVQPPTPAPPAP